MWGDVKPTGGVQKKRYGGSRHFDVRNHRIEVAKTVAEAVIAELKPDTYNVKHMRREQVTLCKQRREDGLGATDAQMYVAGRRLDRTRDEVGQSTDLGYYDRAATWMRTRSRNDPHMINLLGEIAQEEDVIKQKKGAQCGELSRNVFYRLVNMGETPCHSIFADRVNLWGAKPGSPTFEQELDNHAFTALGLEHPKKFEDMRNWPDTVIICDPWMMMLTKDTREHQTGVPGAYTPAQYLQIVEPYFLNGGTVQVSYGVED
jgi:hypothetical protein